MKLIPRYLLIFAAIIGFASTLPSFYRTVANRPAERLTASYSDVVGDFVGTSTSAEGVRTYYDNNKNKITQREYAKLLPFIYTSDLKQWNEWPETIGGVAVPLHSVGLMSESGRVSVLGIDWTNTRIPLYPMFESDSGFVELVMPDELFRITDAGMEFVYGSTNKVLPDESALFTNAMLEKGFVFPAKIIAGNPTTRKPYDFGYFIQDANNEIFQVYKAKGQPIVIKTNIKPDGEIVFISVGESEYSPYYGIVVTREGGLYWILKDNYKLEKHYVDNYDPSRDLLTYSSNPLSITVRTIRDNTERLYVSNWQHELIATYVFTEQSRLRGAFKSIHDAIFPYEVKPDNSKAGGDIHLVKSNNVKSAVIMSVLFALAYVIFRRRRGGLNSPLVCDVVCVLAGGIYGLIALLLLDSVGFKRRPVKSE